MAEIPENITKKSIEEVKKLLEKTTAQTGETLEAIATNSFVRSINNFLGLDWLMTFLGEVNLEKVKKNIQKVKLRYPEATEAEIAQYLITNKSWEAARLGLITNIIPPVAVILIGLELTATARLQAEMVYEIAGAYNLDLETSARRGEVVTILGLSFSLDILKTGLSIVEIIPGIGAVIGASTNAAILYVLGQTATRYYNGKKEEVALTELATENQKDWEIAIAQSKIADQVIAYMVKITYPEREWREILPTLEEISPSSVTTVAIYLKQPQSLDTLLAKLSPEFAPLVLTRCIKIAQSHGEITPEEEKVLSQIAQQFNLDLVSQMSSNK